MDPLCSHSAALGTAEVPPKGTARAKDRQGSRRSRRRRRNGRRPKEGGQGPGAAGGANGQTGRCSGPMFMHFLFGKQKVQKHWAGVTPRQATRGARRPRAGAEGAGLASNFYHDWANRSIMVGMGAKGEGPAARGGRHGGPAAGRGRRGVGAQACNVPAAANKVTFSR